MELRLSPSLCFHCLYDGDKSNVYAGGGGGCHEALNENENENRTLELTHSECSVNIGGK